MPPYAYLRKSSVRHLETDLSPETQEREIRTLAARHGDNGSKLVMLADWDISGRGKFTKKRQAYQELVAAVDSGLCSAVYSYSLSRLGRSVHELSGLFDLCAERHVPIRLVADSVDTSTASGILLANVLSSVAQFEADVASERTKAAHATRRARGERVGPRFYGESAGEDEATVVAAYREAGSYHGAAKLLNERGVPTRHGRVGGWWSSSVGKMVKRLEPSTRPGRARTKSIAGFRLSRLLVCPTCGLMLTGRINRGTIRYDCAQGSSRPHARVSVAERAILPAVQAETARLMTPEAIEHLADDAGRRAALEAQRLRVLDMFQAGNIDRDDRERRLAGIYEDLSMLDAKRTIRQVPQLDWSWSPREMNGVLRGLFSRIDLDAEFQPVAFEWTVPEWRS